MHGWALARLLLLGVAFHALCIVGIFDIYFQSPVESSIPSAEYAAAGSAPAKRVIVFTLDGCRVDKLYKVVAGFPHSLNLNPGNVPPPETNRHGRTPFLGDVMRRRGSWGVSHNHVPTESRPCHVALTAGMYEDPHAVTKSWKQHPVPFDSVFNQSNNAFVFGNRDVAPMLARHAPQAQEEHYSAKDENEMAREDPSLLDVWSFRKMKELFARATEAREKELYDKFHDDRLVIYCHFLGTDLSGPKYGAGSREYLDNIAVVDELIEKTEKMVEKYFGNDGRTAYIVNSDHGMDLRGGHGENDPAKTRTALIAWGAGIQKPVPVSNPNKKRFDIDLPTQSKAEIQLRLEAQALEETVAVHEWATLVDLKRRDAMQTDVAPLISALAGLPYPRNSVGVLPFTYLNKNKYRANALRANALQLYQHALRKEEVRRANRGFLFVPYLSLHKRVPDLISQIDKALNSLSDGDDEVHAGTSEAHRLVEVLTQEMNDICKGAIMYYQRYEWLFLFSSIVLGYAGWALVVVLAYLHPVKFRLRWLIHHMLDLKTMVAVVAMFWWRNLANSPRTYYLYGICPLMFWRFVWARREDLRAALTFKFQGSKMTISLWSPSLHFVWIFACLELVVRGYTHRAAFSVLFSALAVWPWIFGSQSARASSIDGKLWRGLLSPRMCWSMSCVFIAIFPTLPTENGLDTMLVHFGSLLTLGFVLVVMKTLPVQQARRPQLKSVLGSGIPTVVMALLTLQWTAWTSESKAYPPFFLAAANWSISIVPVLLLLFQTKFQSTTSSFKVESEDDLERQQTTNCSSSLLVVRLIRVIVAFVPSFALLSTSYEMLFYLALCSVLVSWIRLEARHPIASNSLMKCEAHRALIFLVVVQMSFFGTCSVTSMTDFKIESARRFLTHPAPTLAQLLVVMKLLIPFIVVACAFRLVLLLPAATGSSARKKNKLGIFASQHILLSVAMAEYLAVRFLFVVNNEGSWKQMGNSIAVFCIGNAQILLLPLLIVLGWAFVHDMTPSRDTEVESVVATIEPDKAR